MIKFILFASDGRVRVMIKNVIYEYVTPTYHHDRWRRSKRSGRMLAEVKRCASEVRRLV